MTKVEELEKALKEAKEQENTNNIERQLILLQAEYKGKAFGTNTFQKKSISSYLTAVFFEDFFIKEKKIYVIEWSFYINRTGTDHSLDHNNLNFQRRKQTKVVENNRNNLLNYNKKSFEAKRFLEIWSMAETSQKLFLENVFKSNLLEEKEEYSESLMKEMNYLDYQLEKSSYDIIDTRLYPELYNALRFEFIPFYQHNTFLPKNIAKNILEEYVKSLKTYKNMPSNAIKVSNDRKIKIVENFIKETL
jgi:hypothetical protein